MKRIAQIVLISILLGAACAADTIGVASDPTRLGVGARPLGMGKAFLGLADDASALFLNPAGLSLVKGLTATSMTAKFLNEVDYNTLGVAYPALNGVFGLGYVGANISMVTPLSTFETVGDQIRIIPSTTESASYNFSDSVVLLSYGLPVGKLLAYPWAKHLHAGANLKMFVVNLSGPGVSGGDAQGNEIDLGLLYKPDDWYSVGLNAQNILPFDMGGKLTYGSGNTESFPAVIKVGLRLHLMGAQNAYQDSIHELSLLVDQDYSLRSIPTLTHLGLEWSPHPLLALRLGLDQDLVGKVDGGLKPYNNLTTGVGLAWREASFDYAYHQYQETRANDTHYFSLSYAFRPVVIKDMLKVDIPKDKSVVYEEKLVLKGRVLEPVVKEILVQDVPTSFGQDGSFRRDIELKLKKNKISVTGSDMRGNVLEEEPVRLLRLKTFKDVAKDHWARLPIGYLATLDIIGGYPDGTFRPDGNITRAEMCTLLVKTMAQESMVARLKFLDVPLRHWAAIYIAQASDGGMVKGYPDVTFKPNGLITRAEGVTILARFAKLPEPRVVEVPFSDLPGRHWAYQYVSSAKEAGILRYLRNKPFEPEKALTRAEVAEMLARTGLVAKKVKDMIDWETY